MLFGYLVKAFFVDDFALKVAVEAAGSDENISEVTRNFGKGGVELKCASCRTPPLVLARLCQYATGARSFAPSSAGTRRRARFVLRGEQVQECPSGNLAPRLFPRFPLSRFSGMQKTHLVGARTHNLRSVSVDLAEGELVCLTGVSGAGKSSLALDTLYAEGQRRFVESFSPYARQFLERLERPPDRRARAGRRRRRGRSPRAGEELALDRRDDGRYRAVLLARCSRARRCRSARRAASRRCAPIPRRRPIAALDGHEGATALVTYRVPRRAGPRRSSRCARRCSKRRLSAAARRRARRAISTRSKPSEAHRRERRRSRWSSIASRSRRAIGGASARPIEEAWKRGGGRRARSCSERAGSPRAARARARVPEVRARVRVRRAPGSSRTSRRPARAPSAAASGAPSASTGTRSIPDETADRSKGARSAPWTGKSTEWEREMLAQVLRKRRTIPLDVPWTTLAEQQRELVIDGRGDVDGGKYPGVQARGSSGSRRAPTRCTCACCSRATARTIPAQRCGGKRLHDTVAGLPRRRARLRRLARARAAEAARRSRELARRAPGRASSSRKSCRSGSATSSGSGSATSRSTGRRARSRAARRSACRSPRRSGPRSRRAVRARRAHGGPAPERRAAARRGHARAGARGNIVLVIEHEPLGGRAAAIACSSSGPAPAPHGGS